MLRILRFDVVADWVVLILQGRIAGEWADLLERECLDLIQSGLRVVLDLSGVDLIGRSGLEVLGRLGRAGVRISGCTPLIADTLEQEGIEVDRSTGDTADEKVPGKRGGTADA